MRKNTYLKKGAKYLSNGEDCLNEKAKTIILSDDEFNRGIHSDDGVGEGAIIRLAKHLGFFEDDDDYAAFRQNLVIIANNETGKRWWDAGDMGIELW